MGTLGAYNLSSSEISAYASKAGFSGDDLGIAVAVAQAESHGNPTAHNSKPPDDSYGLWQINMLGALGPERRKQFGITSNVQLYDPTTNAKAAYMIWKGSGWKAWTTYTSDEYKKYLDSTTSQTGTLAQGTIDPKSQYSGITGAVQAVGDNLFKAASNFTGILIAIVFLVLGIVLLARKPLMNVLPAGKVIKAAKAVGI
jgi:Lysozyme like domain